LMHIVTPSLSIPYTTRHLFYTFILCPLIPTLFPYTTLFRSNGQGLRPLPAQGDRARLRGHRFRGDRRGARAAAPPRGGRPSGGRSEEHTSELQSRFDLVCRLLLEKKKKTKDSNYQDLNQNCS